MLADRARRGAAAPLAPPSPSWHALSAEEALAAIDSDGDRGLSAEEATRRLARLGRNALPAPPRRSLAAVILGQLASPLVSLLGVAALVALVFGEVGDALVIAAVVVLNALIGAVQEGRAERSLAALRRLVRHPARVVRGSQALVIEASEVVPGDLLELEAGDAVPADARLLHGAALQVSEAALTGESAPVDKAISSLTTTTPLADRHNMVHAGTYVTAGRARAVVTATGLATELGRIAGLAEAATQPPTPLERRIAQVGRHVIVAAAVLFALIVVVGMLREIPPSELVMVAISQVVGLIPEGLPVAMTIALAVGVQRMARRRAVVRRMAAVETLGSTTVVCSDKTGTLTRNEMTVAALHLPGGGADGSPLDVTVHGVGYAPEGRLSIGEKPLADDHAGVRELLEAALLCSNADLAAPDPTAEDASWRPIGDPTEVALVVAAIKIGLVPVEVHGAAPRRAELPFDPACKMMATQHATPRGVRVIVKGAPEEVLELCGALRRGGSAVPLDEPGRLRVRAAVAEMAGRALRVLAIATVESSLTAGGAPVQLDGTAGFAALSGRLVLLGLIGQIDPPRPEVREAVGRCRAAGIRVVVITGDHKQTALAIARQLGIAEPGDGGCALDGRELDALDEQALDARLGSVTVFARVHPAQKLRLVEAYQRRGEVVAMTGDGVNDAPALVRADVGVAMGQGGTEVAKESAQVVLGDDNFATIVAAVEEGRVVYRNVQKAVLLLFSTSIAEVLLLLLALIAGYPPPFAAVQILWNNLVTEGLITVNLVMEPAEGDEMRRPPVARDERLLSRLLVTRMAFMVPVICAVTLGWFAARTAAGVPAGQVRTEAFVLLAICEWWNVLNCRSETASALSLDVLRNRWLLAGLVAGNLLQAAVVFWPPLQRVFHTVPVGWREAIALGAVGSLVLWVEELRKLLVRRRRAG